MDRMNWTTRREVWRELMDRPSSAQRKRVETFLKTRPALLYWGDSWFSTPLYLNLARQSILRTDGMAMLIGKPGATASELFTAARIREIAGRVAGSPFDAVCLSAGGNDRLSDRLEKRFAAWIPPRRSAQLGAQEAFEFLAADGGFEVVRKGIRTDRIRGIGFGEAAWAPPSACARSPIPGDRAAARPAAAGRRSATSVSRRRYALRPPSRWGSCAAISARSAASPSPDLPGHGRRDRLCTPRRSARRRHWRRRVRTPPPARARPRILRG